MFSDEELDRLAARKAQIDKRKEMTTHSNNSGDTDVSGVTGHLAVYRVYNDGSEELVMEGQNAITNNPGKVNISRLLGGLFAAGDSTNHSVAILAVGNGSPHLTTADAEAANDLVAPISTTRTGADPAYVTSYTVLGRNLNSNELTIVNTNQLQLEFTLGASGGAAGGTPAAWDGHSASPYAQVSTNITEVGLFSNSTTPLSTNPSGHSVGEMMAYKKLDSGIAYDSSETNFSILFRWTISFSNT